MSWNVDKKPCTYYQSTFPQSCLSWRFHIHVLGKKIADYSFLWKKTFSASGEGHKTFLKDMHDRVQKSVDLLWNNCWESKVAVAFKKFLTPVGVPSLKGGNGLFVAEAHPSANLNDNGINLCRRRLNVCPYFNWGGAVLFPPNTYIFMVAWKSRTVPLGWPIGMITIW